MTPEGEFLRRAGIEKHWVTSSGYMSCVSPSGKYLGATAAKAFEAFRSLPEDERSPGAVKVPELKPSERYIPSPPVAGLVLKVHARPLHRDDKGELRKATVDDFPLMDGRQGLRLFLEPNTEYMWLTEAEWKSLLPAKLVKGTKLAVPPAIVERMARFHLSPRRAMTSEGGILAKKEIKSAELTLEIVDVAPERIRLYLEGYIHTGSDYDEAQATSPNGPLAFGYAAAMHGFLEYDRKSKQFVRFDTLALGDVWGRWGDANGKSLFAERPGQSPFVFVFELANGNTATNRLPPGGNGLRSIEHGYFTTSK